MEGAALPNPRVGRRVRPYRVQGGVKHGKPDADRHLRESRGLEAHRGKGRFHRNRGAASRPGHGGRNLRPVRRAVDEPERRAGDGACRRVLDRTLQRASWRPGPAAARHAQARIARYTQGHRDFVLDYIFLCISNGCPRPCQARAGQSECSPVAGRSACDFNTPARGGPGPEARSGDHSERRVPPPFYFHCIAHRGLAARPKSIT